MSIDKAGHVQQTTSLHRLKAKSSAGPLSFTLAREGLKCTDAKVPSMTEQDKQEQYCLVIRGHNAAQQ